MPYFKIETNQTLNDLGRQELLKKASTLMATLLGKPEQYMMVSLQLTTPMLFAGNAGPLAYVTLKGIGLRRDQCSTYAKEICDFLNAELSISPDRIYIEFSDIEGAMFGWNRGTF